MRLEQGFSILVEYASYPARYCLQSWAILAGVEGRLVEAAQLIAFADAERTRRGEILDPSEFRNYNLLTGILEAGLPPAELAACKAEGAGWSEAEAIEFVANRLLLHTQDSTDRAADESRGHIEYEGFGDRHLR